MPIKNKQQYNSYLNDYMKDRWIKRRQAAILQLGGCCVKCGAVDELEFDHIDPSTKLKTIARLSSASEKVFQEELSKCQLLCVECHKEKHAPLVQW